jgi:protein-disulfide isomerase
MNLGTMSAKARERARELRRAREAAERQRLQRRRLLAGGGVVIAGLLIAIVVAMVNAAGGSATPQAAPSAGPVVTPSAATASGALTVGRADAPVRLEIFLDYMCPYCGRFERANAAELNRLVADGTVRLELYPLSFLDRMSNGSRYSTRTANAIATVADRAPDKLLAFNGGLFARQPEENTSGLSDDEIATLATSAGVPAEVVNSFADRRFESWVTSMTDRVMASGVNSTPTVRINGTKFTGDLYTVGPLTQAITAAKAG